MLESLERNKDSKTQVVKSDKGMAICSSPVFGSAWPCAQYRSHGSAAAKKLKAAESINSLGLKG